MNPDLNHDTRKQFLAEHLKNLEGALLKTGIDFLSVDLPVSNTSLYDAHKSIIESVVRSIQLPEELNISSGEVMLSMR